MRLKSKARIFVESYWMTNDSPSKAVTTILNWIKDNKLTKEGRNNYKILIENINETKR